MLIPPSNKVVIQPMFDPDKIGSIFVPDQAKTRCKQGLIKYVGPQCKEDFAPGDYVFFSAYSGDLFMMEGEEVVIIMEEDRIICKMPQIPPTEIAGLYFSDGKEYYPATYEHAMFFIAKAIQDSKWFEHMVVKHLDKVGEKV